MEQKKNTRLNANQKKIIDILSKSKILDNVKIDIFLKFDDITLDEIKKINRYNRIHNNIKILLEYYNIEPHNIFDIINTYDGKNKIFQKLKNFILNRNILILKKIYKSEQWEKNIIKLIDNFNKIYDDANLNEYLDNIILKIILNDINIFDICKYRLILDQKNKLKNINLFNLEDQKTIITELNIVGCKKKIL
jgi:hypothetical protein